MLGILEAVGLIKWLNNPDKPPATVLKVADVGFFALAGIFFLAVVFLSFHQSLVYQTPLARFGFYPPAILLVIRCLFEMLFALNIIKIPSDKIPILRYFTVTLLEMIIVCYWGATMVSRTLQLKGPDLSVDPPSTYNKPPTNANIHGSSEQTPAATVNTNAQDTNAGHNPAATATAIPSSNQNHTAMPGYVNAYDNPVSWPNARPNSSSSQHLAAVPLANFQKQQPPPHYSPTMHRPSTVSMPMPIPSIRFDVNQEQANDQSKYRRTPYPTFGDSYFGKSPTTDKS